jgi:hypothetical protein
MSKEKQKQRKKEAQKKAIKNAERELKKIIPPANYRTFAGESKDKLVSDLQNIDVTDDKKLTMGFYKAFGLPIPADLIEKYDIKEEEL